MKSRFDPGSLDARQGLAVADQTLVVSRAPPVDIATIHDRKDSPGISPQIRSGLLARRHRDLFDRL